MIDIKNPMHQLLLEHPRLLPLLPRFGIGLGFGEKSVGEVCDENKVNSHFFMEIARTYIDEVSDLEVKSLPLSCVVKYIRSTHLYYTERALPAIEGKVKKLTANSDLSTREKELLHTFFEDYKKDFLAHINKEETEVLPYIMKIEKAAGESEPDPDLLQELENYSIREFEKEHDRLETSLQHLSELIMIYLPPFRDQQLCIEVLQDLSDLVRDLVEHADMEDIILVPGVLALEEQLKTRKPK